MRQTFVSIICKMLRVKSQNIIVWEIKNIYFKKILNKYVACHQTRIYFKIVSSTVLLEKNNPKFTMVFIVE